ncbi:DUF4246 domain-containing protein [Acrasis kona]|uniref:DUF4246 domain-containing protein n=1 Tax=Acrasis kona TaxID=1008807 RepID=A0AAW2YKA4_9EUKA
MRIRRELDKEEDDNGSVKYARTDREPTLPSVFEIMEEENLSNPFQKQEYGIGVQPKTLLELEMIGVSGEIRSKERWWEKMKDDKIVNKWRGECKLSKEAFDYILKELDYYNYIREGTTQMSPVDLVWQSDDLISATDKQELIRQVKKLEDVPSERMDWHPNSNEQVLDLVHPSLYCLVSNTSTKINNASLARQSAKDMLYHMNTGEVIVLKHDILDDMSFVSDQTQWIPSEVQVDSDGKVKFLSYINNLHPQNHSALYGVLENITAKFVPLWENVLKGMTSSPPPRCEVRPYSWYENKENIESKAKFREQYKKDNPDLPSDDEDFEDAFEEEWDIEKGHHLYVSAPTVYEFKTPEINENFILKDSRLQIIVKLANIHLTPEKPTYEGGTYHIEGMKNEGIVASGIYYYEFDNISESVLRFRMAVSEPEYEQGDDFGVNAIYGIGNDDKLNQVVGGVITKQDRCIAFPNSMQHRVEPFELVDKTRPGYRKILVLFLIDPGTRILSTADIPPQQKEWLVQELALHLKEKLPIEIISYIVQFMPSMMNLEQAKQHRDKLMQERGMLVRERNEMTFERTFSLCEH